MNVRGLNERVEFQWRVYANVISFRGWSFRQFAFQSSTFL